MRSEEAGEELHRVELFHAARFLESDADCIRDPMNQPTNVSRRRFLTLLVAVPVVAYASLWSPASAAQSKDWRQVALDRDRWLSLERASTGEKGAFRYYRYGVGLDRRGYEIACYLLRDVKSNVTIRMSLKLLDLLCIMQTWLRANGLPYHMVIHSGYRTPEHNRQLTNSARNSEHMNGTAADIRIPGVSIEQLNKLALAVGVGGVGIYPKNGIIHVDVGRVRRWQG